MKHSFFQTAVVSILLHGCTTRMLRAILNKSWRQHTTRQQIYGHLPPITKTIQVRRTRHAGHCLWSSDELISDVLLWNPTYGRAKAGRPARTYIQQLCEDTGCNPKDLPDAMNDREKWRERVRDIHASGTTSQWWWFLKNFFTVIYEWFLSNIRNLHSFVNLKIFLYNSYNYMTLSNYFYVITAIFLHKYILFQEINNNP